MTPEDKFKNKIIRKLKEFGGYWIVVPRSRYTASGKPDIIGCYEGKFFGIEVKRPDGVGSYGVTALQLQNLKEIDSNGGHAYVVDNEAALKDLLKEVERLGRMQYHSI